MIIVQLIGGIGNQMFQYACGRHLAILNNTELKLDISLLQNRVPFSKDFVFRNYDLDIFNIKATIATASDIALYPLNWKINSIPHRLYNLFQIRKKGYKYVLEWKLNSYNRILFDEKILKMRGNIYLAGYWSSPQFFNAISGTIKNDFSFKKELTSNSIALKEKITSCNSVCINVRRKEFLVVKAMGFHGIDYIRKAIEVIVQRYDNPVFFIFSDDLEWCRDNIKLNFPSCFVGEEYYGDKFSDYLQLMMSCRHFIIPNSSFAWWAAWLANNEEKIVTVPTKYFHGLNSKDLIPDEWIKI